MQIATPGINNAVFGNSALKVNTNTNTKDNNIFGGGALIAATTGTILRNSIFGFEALNGLTRGAIDDSIFLGYQCMKNLTSGSISDSIFIGDLIIAAAVTNVLSNVLVIGRNQTLKASPLVNYVQIGNTSHTKFYLPPTAFNTSGIVISTGSGDNNDISSVTTITPAITFDAGILTDTISEKTLDTG